MARVTTRHIPPLRGERSARPPSARRPPWFLETRSAAPRTSPPRLRRWLPPPWNPPPLLPPPPAGVLAAGAKGAPPPPLHQQVDHPVAGPGVEGADLVPARPEGAVGPPADVHHRQRRRQLRGLGARQVVDRRQRRALPARGRVGRAEVERHRPPAEPRQHRPVAQLHRAARLAIPGPLI